MTPLTIIGIIAGTWIIASVITTILAVLFFKGRNRAWESEKAHNERLRIDEARRNLGGFPGTYGDR